MKKPKINKVIKILEISKKDYDIIEHDEELHEYTLYIKYVYISSCKIESLIKNGYSVYFSGTRELAIN